MVQAVHMIEHVAEVIRGMEEFHRLVRAVGEVIIVTPHYTDFRSFCDPSHRWHLNSFSLRYFGGNHGGFGYYSAARIEELSVRVNLLALWRWLGFEMAVNASPRFRRFWEHYLCYVVRGKAIEWRLRVVEYGGSVGPPLFRGIPQQRQLSVDDFLELGHGLRAAQKDSVDEESGCPSDPDLGSLLQVGRYFGLELAAFEACLKRLHIQIQLRGVGDQIGSG